MFMPMASSLYHHYHHHQISSAPITIRP